MVFDTTGCANVSPRSFSTIFISASSGAFLLVNSAASAPRAGRILYVDTERGEIIGETQLQDSCGLTGITNSAFALSSGMGVVQTEQPDHTHLTTATFPGRSFDNHLRMIV